MKNETAVSMKFENKVTGLAKLEKYEQRLKALQKAMKSMPNSVLIDSKPIDNVTNSEKKANKATETLNSSLTKTKSLLNKGFNTIGLIALGRGLKSAFGNMQKYIDASSAYVENLNLMQVAFKETGKANDRFNESFVNGLADIFGLDESTMTRQLGFYRQIGNALNVDSKYADLLSKNLLKLQLDMSSLYNLSFEKAGEVIQSSIAGQTKPVRGATGADITQATLQTTLDDLGIDRAISDLSRGEKVLTIYLSLVNQLSESQGDLAKTINSVANQEKIFTEQTSRMSRMVGNVLSVSVGKALPYLNAFLMVINELIERFAIFVGFELPTYEQNGGYDLSDYLDDVSDSASKAKKELQGLRPFDKLNLISTPKKDKGLGVGGGIDKRLLEALKEYDLKISDIDNKATKIRDKVMEWLGFTKEVNAETGEITWKYDTLGKSAEQIAKEVGTNLAEALSKETQKIKWGEYGHNLAVGVNTTLGFVNSFVDNYNWFSLGQGFARGLNKSIEEISWEDVGKAFTNKLKIIISTASGFLQTLDYEELGKSIAEFINGAIGNIPIKDLTKGINAFSKGLLTAFTEAIKTLDWGEIGSAIGEVLTGLNWESYLLIAGIVFRKSLVKSLVGKGIKTELEGELVKSLGSKISLKSLAGWGAGLALSTTGLSNMDKSLKKVDKDTSSFNYTTGALTTVLGGLILGIKTGHPVLGTFAGALAVVNKGLIDVIKTSKESNFSLDYVSEKTKTAYSEVKPSIESAYKSISKLNTSLKLSDGTKQDIENSIGDLVDQVGSKITDSKNATIDSINEMVKKGYISPEEKENALKSSEEYYNGLTTQNENAQNRIIEIMQIAKDQKGYLTEGERDEITSLYEQLESNTIDILTTMDGEQMAIYEDLKRSKTKLSKEAAQEIIQSALNTKNETIKAAQEQYRTEVSEAYKMKEAGIINEETYNKMVDGATKTRDETIKSAEEQYDGIWNEFTTNQSDIAKYIDKDTGEVKSKWKVFWEDIGDKVKKIDWLQIGKDALNSLINGIFDSSIFGRLTNFGETIFTTVKDSFSGKSFKDIGKGVLDGVIKGMTPKASSFANWGKNTIKSIKGALGIHSPSKLVIDNKIGDYVTQGIEVGMDKETNKGFKKQTKNIVDTLHENIIDFDSEVNTSFFPLFGVNSKTIQGSQEKFNPSNINQQPTRQPMIFNMYLDKNHQLGSYTLEQLQDLATANGGEIPIG